MFHRLREYIDIKKCGIAQLSYALHIHGGGGINILHYIKK